MTDEQKELARGFEATLRSYRQFCKDNIRVIFEFECWQAAVATATLLTQADLDEYWNEQGDEFAAAAWGTFTEITAVAGYDLDKEPE